MFKLAWKIPPPIDNSFGSLANLVPRLFKLSMGNVFDKSGKMQKSWTNFFFPHSVIFSLPYAYDLSHSMSLCKLNSSFKAAIKV